MKIKKLFKKMLETLIGQKIITVSLDSNPIIIDPSTQAKILPIQYSYRASDEGIVTYRLLEDGKNFNYALFSAEYSEDLKQLDNPPCVTFTIGKVSKGDLVEVNLIEKIAWINSQQISTSIQSHLSRRKYYAHISLTSYGQPMQRTCPHYLPFQNKKIGNDYYFGDDYINYPKQINTSRAINTVKAHKAAGTLLDVGCALGYYTKAFQEAGYEAYGIDSSAYAVEQAKALVGDNQIELCDLDSEDIPFKQKFDVIYMWDVLEHSANPSRMLQKVTSVAKKGALLVLHTSNSHSLTHLILGMDWEGYSDYSHSGVDIVHANSLQQWLKELGWEVKEWECNNIWINGRDQTLLGLREAFNRIPELNTFLLERNLGDTINVVAQKISPRSTTS